MRNNIFYIIAAVLLHSGISLSCDNPSVMTQQRIGLSGTIEKARRLTPDIFDLKITNTDQHFSKDWHVNIAKKDIDELLEQSKKLEPNGYITFELKTHGYELKSTIIIEPKDIERLKEITITDKRDCYQGSTLCDGLSEISNICCKSPATIESPISKKTLFFGLGSCALIVFLICYFKNNITQYIS